MHFLIFIILTLSALRNVSALNYVEDLKRHASMQVSFHSAKSVKKIKVAAKVNDIVNRLNRTKKELYPDLSAEKDSYDKEVRPGLQ